jgi:branched-chain amino acid transport system substrate-binding protein
MLGGMPGPRLSRRAFLAGGASLLAPRPARAEPPSVKIGALHPVTGPLADAGRACRLAAQIAADDVNAAGGLRALGGARLEVVFADTQTRQEVARAEAERLAALGVAALIGCFNSGDSAAVVPVAQRRRLPFLIDISAADLITASVARAVRDGREKAQWVYRLFPTSTMLGQRAVQYFDGVFKHAGVSSPRVVLMHGNDLFGHNQARGFLAAHRAARPGWGVVETIAWPEPPAELAAEVARAKAARPDVLAPITRPGSARLLLPEIARQRLDLLGILSPGSPGLYEAGQVATLKDHLEHVMTAVPWPDFKKLDVRRFAEEFTRRSTGRTLDTHAGYSYDAIQVLANAFERARSREPDALIEALRTTRFADTLMVGAGPVAFNDTGDNANAAPALIQVLGQRPWVVWPLDVAERTLAFPRPRG